MSTEKNLEAAFSGESEANRKYLAFAKQADKENHPKIAKLFRAAAAGETVHAHAHLRALGNINSTAENLKSAMEGESYEFKNMYPDYIAEAQKDENRAAEIAFKNAMAVEQVHYSMYSEALKRLGNGEEIQIGKVFVCSVCGNLVLDEAPEKCPVCGAPASKFDEVE